MRGICRLCLTEAELSESHIIPAFVKWEGIRSMDSCFAGLLCVCIKHFGNR